MNDTPLKLLHAEGVLIELKLEFFRKLSTDDIVESLTPGTTHGLKTRPDGTIMDGNHRVTVLLERDIEIDDLPREIWERLK